MRSRTLLSVALCLVLLACGSSVAERLSLALAGAQALPAALNLPAKEQKCAAEIIGRVSTSVDGYRAHPDATRWKLVGDAVASMDFSQCTNNPRVIALAPVITRIFQSLVPAGTAAVEGAPVSQTPDLSHVDEADLKELERLVKN